jgi:single-stranded DNA-binding protein
MKPEPNPLPLNLVMLTGRILKRTDLSRTSLGKPVITLVLVETDPFPRPAGSAGFAEELSVELWGDLAEEHDDNLKPGALVFVEAQVAGRQRQDRDTKLVHHWMILKARKVQILS